MLSPEPYSKKTLDNFPLAENGRSISPMKEAAPSVKRHSPEAPLPTMHFWGLGISRPFLVLCAFSVTVRINNK